MSLYKTLGALIYQAFLNALYARALVIIDHPKSQFIGSKSIQKNSSLLKTVIQGDGVFLAN